MGQGQPRFRPTSAANSTWYPDLPPFLRGLLAPLRNGVFPPGSTFDCSPVSNETASPLRGPAPCLYITKRSYSLRLGLPKHFIGIISRPPPNSPARKGGCDPHHLDEETEA